jgi:hypothetical protein
MFTLIKIIKISFMVGLFIPVKKHNRFKKFQNIITIKIKSNQVLQVFT